MILPLYNIVCILILLGVAAVYVRDIYWAVIIYIYAQHQCCPLGKIMYYNITLL